jgi:hypothetical protein
MKGREIIVMKDDIAEKLDEMADLCEIWKRNRNKGHEPNAIRKALMMVANEVVVMESIQSINDKIDSVQNGSITNIKL